MTREAHLEAGSRYRECAIRAIASFRETMDKKYWEDYKANSKLANKHCDIAQAMFTRKYGRI